MAKVDFADLEISLHRFSAEPSVDPTAEEKAQVVYEVDFRFTQPGTDAETRLAQERPALVTFDRAALLACGADWAAYGQELTQQLFTEEVCGAFLMARAVCDAAGLYMRFRLMVGPSAPELHSLRWETLRDPGSKALLCTSQRLCFSRYLNSADWRPVRPRPKEELRALAAVANPVELSSPDSLLPALDPAKELANIQAGLGDAIPLDALPGAGSTEHASLAAIDAALRIKPYDIFYLVCHGQHLKDGTHLLLEDENGHIKDTLGSQLVELFYNLDNRPQLVVLVSCESAGAANGIEKNTLLGLGPMLAEAGIPAVIAMQSPVSLDTISGFMPAFFRGLDEDGIIDRAFATARAVVRGEQDAWAPVLYMRLKTGRLWYVPGFGDEGDNDVWPRLILRLQSYIDSPDMPSQVTPVIGHGLVEPILGSFSQIAQRWADQHNFPMSPYESESVAQVAQYLAINQDRQYPYQTLRKSLRQNLLEDFPTLLKDQPEETTLDQMVSLVGAERRKDPGEPHRILAELPLPVYLTANYNTLLEEALVEAGRAPETLLCPWFRDSERIETVYDREKYIPSKKRPLVFHLFGRMDVPESVALTEDDYFDYLMGISRNKNRIPKDVLGALAASTMLFIGFQLEDWNFRVLLHSIMALADQSIDRRPANIAAQIEPEEGRTLKPSRARKYIEQYFSQDAKISLYWGGADAFMRELKQRWEART